MEQSQDVSYSVIGNWTQLNSDHFSIHLPAVDVVVCCVSKSLILLLQLPRLGVLICDQLPAHMLASVSVYFP